MFSSWLFPVLSSYRFILHVCLAAQLLCHHIYNWHWQVFKWSSITLACSESSENHCHNYSLWHSTIRRPLAFFRFSSFFIIFSNYFFSKIETLWKYLWLLICVFETYFYFVVEERGKQYIEKINNIYYIAQN